LSSGGGRGGAPARTELKRGQPNLLYTGRGGGKGGRRNSILVDGTVAGERKWANPRQGGERVNFLRGGGANVNKTFPARKRRAWGRAPKNVVGKWWCTTTEGKQSEPVCLGKKREKRKGKEEEGGPSRKKKEKEQPVALPAEKKESESSRLSKKKEKKQRIYTCLEASGGVEKEFSIIY